MYHKKMQSKSNPNDVKNLKKIVKRMDNLATAGDVDKLKAELLEQIEQRNKARFASLPAKMKLRILRVLNKEGK